MIFLLFICALSVMHICNATLDSENEFHVLADNRIVKDNDPRITAILIRAQNDFSIPNQDISKSIDNCLRLLETELAREGLTLSDKVSATLRQAKERYQKQEDATREQKKTPQERALDIAEIVLVDLAANLADELL